jgi:hypothetical protein
VGRKDITAKASDAHKLLQFPFADHGWDAMQIARTLGLGSPLALGQAVGQVVRRRHRAGLLEEDGAEVGRRLCRNPEARRGHSRLQTTIGIDEMTKVQIPFLFHLQYPPLVSRVLRMLGNYNPNHMVFARL